MVNGFAYAGLVICALLFSLPVAAQDKLVLYLNWKAGPEHAPLFYAERAGLYARAGVQVAIEPGSGSGRIIDVVAKHPGSMGVADFQSVLTARSKGTEVVAVMSLFVNSPYMFYWLKNSGIRSIRDFAGKRIGSDARDPARQLWRALAKVNGIDADAVRWVDVPNEAKPSALRERTVDIVINAFPDSFHLYPEVFGENLVVLPWREAGLNPYNISLIASSVLLHDNPRLVSAVVRATQAAVASCIVDADPCLDALVAGSPNLQRSEQLANWRLTVGLYQNLSATDLPLGAFAPSRVRDDFETLRDSQAIAPAGDPLSAVDNSFLDARMRASVQKRRP